MKCLILKNWHDQQGATAIEYALIAALISLTLIGAFSATGSSVVDLLGVVQDAFPSSGA